MEAPDREKMIEEQTRAQEEARRVVELEQLK